MSITTTPISLIVNGRGSPTPIGIAAPVDTLFPASKLKITVTGLSTDGAVYLSDGITPVLPGEQLTVAELTGLTFAVAADATGQSALFTYDVSDPSGLTTTGTATLSVVANTDGPQTSPASLSVAANSGPTPINIEAPSDPNDPASTLTITVLGLPADGTIFLADGITAVAAGQSLTGTQLTGLQFAPDAGVVAQSSLFSYSVTDPAGNSSLGTATLSIAPAGNVLAVGPGKQYSTIAAAIAASHDGDTIQVEAGTYVNDFSVINTDITLEGMGGLVNMVCTVQIPNGKAIFVTNADITINNFSFSGAQVADDNGAGIKCQVGSLVLNNDAFFHNQEGLLASSNSSSSITINNCEFADNGIGDGQTHNLYVNAIGNLTIDNSYFHDANVGHEIKSRALNTTIRNSRIYDGPAGTASYSIDLPNGGNALIQNNVIEQGPLSENNKIISIGEEGGVYANTSLTISGNTILNDLSSSPLVVRNSTTATVQITGNQFFGLTSSQIATGPNTQSNNVFLASEPALDTSHPWSPEIAVACFLRGTLIRTGTGVAPIETLAIGDNVMTHLGEVMPIRWIGWRAYDGRFIAGNSPVLPIRIVAGALDEGVPARDLWVSPEHALYIDGMLVPARLLLNGVTVFQPKSIERVEYFHIELDDHRIIFAEGAPSESYVDCDNRAMFANVGEYPRLYPEDDRPHWRFCADRLEGDAVALTAIRAALLDRAEALGHVLEHDPALHLIVDREIVRPRSIVGSIHRFDVPAGAAAVWLGSRSVVPAEVDAGACDIRRLGVPVERIMLYDADLSIKASHDHVALVDGFHRDERSHRWTNGMARIPNTLLRAFAGAWTLEVQVVPSALRYPPSRPDIEDIAA